MSSFATLVRELVHRRIPPLQFDEPDEGRFRRSQAPARLQHFVASGLVALIAYNLFLLTDRTMVPDMFEQALWLRLFVFTPVALVLMIIGVRLKDWVLSLPTVLVEGTLMLTGVYASFTMGLVLVGSTSPFAIMYRAGLVAILIYGNVVQRFRFRYAVVFSVWTVLVCLYSMTKTISTSHPYASLDIPLTMLVGVIAAYTLAVNFRMELQERRRFLRAERAAVLRDEIDASRLELEALARQDALTGLPNRRHFDETMQACWMTASQTHQKLAVLLIDVDHFKAYNDRYGHPTGDQCLRHVAQLLRSLVPPETGEVARWGGEEFIVLLPRMDQTQAMAVAHKLIGGVASLGLRHESSMTARCVTISVGVMSGVPGLVWATPDEFIAGADAALYQAKAAGRNRPALAPGGHAGMLST